MGASPPEPGTGAFRRFEHEGWQRIPDAYDDAFGELTSRAVPPLLDAAHVGSGSQVLDVATGPGYAAAAAAARGARALGLDFSARMVERARGRHPDVEFRVGDAEALPSADGSFDAVVMNFGMLHLERPERAVAEALRVLRPGGRFAFTVWGGPEESVGFGAVLRAVRSHGDPDVPLPAGPPFFRFSDPRESVRVLEEAGFGDVEVERLELRWCLATPEALVEVLLGATVRTAALLRAQPEHVLPRVAGAVAAEAAVYRTDDGVALPMGVVLARASRPR